MKRFVKKKNQFENVGKKNMQLILSFYICKVFIFLNEFNFPNLSVTIMCPMYVPQYMFYVIVNVY